MARFVILNNVDVSGTQTVTSTGSWSTYTTKTFQVSLTAGTGKTLRINFETGFWNPDSLNFQTGCTLPTISNPANKTTGAGNTVSWTLTAGGSPAPTIQWYKGLPGSGTPIAGQTSLTLQLTNVEHGKDGGNYYATATNSCGTKTSAAALLRIPCNGDEDTGPDEMLENVARVLAAQGELCDWTTAIQTNFGTSFGGSIGYNKPVINAATAFIKEPIRAGVSGWNMYDWWIRYLKAELGEGTPGWYFGGQEFGSYDYQKYNLAAVLAVHYQAHKYGRNDIKDLARRWLRASITVLSLAAVPETPTSLHSDGLQFTPAQVYVGPYSALAGERSPWGFWMEPDRNIFMADAIGIGNNHKGERDPTKHVRAFVLGAWPAFVAPAPCTQACNTNAFGLTSAEATALRGIVTNNVLPSNLASYYLGPNLHTQNRYHFVGWDAGRAMLMEASTETNTAPTMGVAFYKTSRQAHFLYPWEGEWWFPPQGAPPNRLHRHGIVPAWGRIDLAGQLMEAGHTTATPQHPAETVTLTNVPWLPTRYRVILDPTAPPTQ